MSTNRLWHQLLCLNLFFVFILLFLSINCAGFQRKYAIFTAFPDMVLAGSHSQHFLCITDGSCIYKGKLDFLKLCRFPTVCQNSIL